MKITISQEGVSPIIIKSTEGLFDKSKKYDYWDYDSLCKWLETKNSLMGKICNACIKVKKHPDFKAIEKDIMFGSYTSLYQDKKFTGKQIISIDMIKQIYKSIGVFNSWTKEVEYKRKKNENKSADILICYVTLPENLKSYVNKFYEIGKSNFTLLEPDCAVSFEKSGNPYWDGIDNLPNNKIFCGFGIGF